MPEKYGMTKDSLMIIQDGETYTLKRTDPKFLEVEKMMTTAISMRDSAEADKIWAQIPTLISKGKNIEAWAQGFFTFKNSALYYKDEVVDSLLYQRISNMIAEGHNPQALFNFWEKLQENPSYRSVKQLYTFLVHQNIAIDAEGFILAYKSVRNDWFDHHSGLHENKVGSIQKMPRNKISDEYDVECHVGFHVGTYGYASTFHAGSNQRVIICSIHPKDVVSVSKSSNATKMRVCEYKVVGVYGGELLSNTVETSVTTSDVVGVEGKVLTAEEKKKKDKPKKSKSVSTVTPTVLPKTDKVEKGMITLTEDQKDWENYKLDDLRKFASRTVHIVGASRMKREDLVEEIKMWVKVPAPKKSKSKAKK